MITSVFMFLFLIWIFAGSVVLFFGFISSVPLKIGLFIILGTGIGSLAARYSKSRFLLKTQIAPLLGILSGNKDEHLVSPVDAETFENLQQLYKDQVRLMTKQALDDIEATRPPAVFQDKIPEGFNLAIQGDYAAADHILGNGISRKIMDAIHAHMESEKQDADESKDSMDSEFSRIDDLSDDLENSVGSMSISSRNAAKANRIAFEARDMAAQNRDIVDRLTHSISLISQSSARIKDIAGSINSIAIQTNLLALNASIEAARAGDAGKGFNVVAMEVKTLSGQAREAADQTRELIDNIIQQVATADKQVQENSNAFSSLVEKSDQTGKLIETIQESSLASSHDMDRIHIGLIQASVSLKGKCRDCGLASTGREVRAPELLIPRTYKIQTQWYPQAQFAGFYLAMEKGYYKDAGLKVELVDGGPESNPIFSLMRGELSFITAWLSSTITVFDRGAEIVLLSQIFQKSGLTLVALKESGIRTIKDLKQKTISSWGGIFEYPIQAMNLEHDLDMEILDAGADLGKVRKGEIDVIAVMSYNELLTIYDSGVKKTDLTLIPMSDVGYNFPEDGLYTSRSLLLNDAQACRQFSDASIRGWEAAKKDKEAALECTMAHHKRSPFQTSRSLQKRMLDDVCRLIDSPDASLGLLQPNGFEQTKKALKRIGMIQNPVDISRFYPKST